MIKSQETADLVTFTEEICNGKLFCAVNIFFEINCRCFTENNHEWFFWREKPQKVIIFDAIISKQKRRSATKVIMFFPNFWNIFILFD